MPHSKPPEVRQIAQLLQAKLIPWVQGGAPLVLLDAPPLSSKRLSIRSCKSAALSAPPRKSGYPHRSTWPDAYLNSVSVTVIGCILEGEADYRAHTPPGAPGREWTVPVEAGSFFVVPPGIPFSGGGKIPWERPNPQSASGRGILFHLRRDGVSCHTYSFQKGRLWLHPYLFLYDFEAPGLGEKLLTEMRRPGGMSHAMTYLYLQLILRSLDRTVAQNNYATLIGPRDSPAEHTSDAHSELLFSHRPVEFACEYIRQSLDKAELNSQSVAQRAGLSERHLNRLFHAELGISVFEFIQQQRGEKAVDLLTHGALPVGQVASYCGFRKHAVFSSWFQRRYGCSPSEFRQKAMSKKRKKSLI